MKIILDDLRPFPDGPYNCVRTFEECIELLRLFRSVDFISLDYNLGTNKTGFDVLLYIKANDIKVKHINIHSDHILGVPMMREYVWEHFPDVTLTFNAL